LKSKRNRTACSRQHAASSILYYAVMAEFAGTVVGWIDHESNKTETETTHVATNCYVLIAKSWLSVGFPTNTVFPSGLTAGYAAIPVAQFICAHAQLDEHTLLNDVHLSVPSEVLKAWR